MKPRILLLEDQDADAALVEREVCRAVPDAEVRAVSTKASYMQAVCEFQPTLIVSDHQLPGFTGRDALTYAQTADPDVAFILVTGSLDEETAVEYMKAGATDYLLKDRLARLGPAVAAALAQNERQRSLRRRQQLLQSAIDADPSLMYVKDWDGRVLLANRATTSAFGTTHEELMGQPAPQVDPLRREAAEVLQEDRDVMTSGRPRMVPEAPITNPATGVEQWFQAVKTPLALSHETRPLLLCVATEITERVRAQRDVLAAQQRLEHVLASSAAVLYVLDASQRVPTPVWVSPNLVDVTGFTAQEAMANPSWQLERVHPDDRDHAMADLLAPGDRGRSEYRLLRKDGSHVWIRDHWRAITDPITGGRQMIGAWLDMTDRKSLELQLLQAQKMEAIGQLAGGVAHDFNNLLTAIMGVSELVLEDLPAESPHREDLTTIYQTAVRGAGLTKQLLAFSRRQVLEPRVLPINAVVSDLRSMLERLQGEDVSLELVLDAEAGLVRVDRGQLEQVVVNLVVNARDAMPSGGILTIETGTAVLNDEYVRQHVGANAGAHAVVAVTDTGIGMDAATQAHIFEPFFTTKQPGKGTGLGLATCYGIIQQSGGIIQVSSEVGRGTTFRVFLPRVEAAEPDVTSAVRGGADRFGTECILLVEDDAQVRALAARALTGRHYRVLEAVNGDDAIRVCQEHRGEIDLLLTDVILPRMNGSDLARRVEERRPGIRVVFMSGYTAGFLGRSGALDPNLAFVPKPFTITGLLGKVREVLDAEPALKS